MGDTDIFEKVFGVRVFIDSENFKRKVVPKNPYIVGEWVEDVEELIGAGAEIVTGESIQGRMRVIGERTRVGTNEINEIGGVKSNVGKVKEIYKEQEAKKDKKNKKNRKFTVYVGKDGIKLVPFAPDVFIKLIFSLRVSGGSDKGINGDIDKNGGIEKNGDKSRDIDKAVFVDGNPLGFGLIFVCGGRVEKFFIKLVYGTSNSNELRAIEFALRKFPGVPIFSDSSYAISVIKRRGVLPVFKVKAHRGNIWNTICDYMLRRFLKGDF